jgi:uncharacterized protein
MKYLLVLAVVLLAFWIWRNNRIKDATPPPSPRKPAALRQPTPMVACLDCGTHLPESEAVKGRQGAYCSAEHRRRHEGTAS